MADKNNPKQDEQDAVWRREQFEKGEKALRGMLATDFGNGVGEFIEPVRLPDPVDPNYPEDAAVLEAVSQILVSQDPNIATVVDQQPSEAVVVAEPEDMPLEAPPLSGVLPGTGITATDPGERAQLREQLLQQRQERQQQQEQKAQVAPPPPPPKQAGQAAEAQGRPPRADTGHGPRATGPLPDFGDAGSTFYQPPTASAVSLVEEASEAADAVGNNQAVVLEILRRLTLNTLSNTEQLMQLMDRIDSEDETDEF